MTAARSRRGRLRRLNRRRRRQYWARAGTGRMPSGRSHAGRGPERLRVPRDYDWDASTAANYAAAHNINDSVAQGSRFVGEFAHLRKTRDHAYHGFYTLSRQLFQDQIVRYYVNRNSTMNRRESSSSDLCDRALSPVSPVLLFTAGAMGSGKSHTLRWISEKHGFPLRDFVICDPDRIREQLPEMEGYRTRWAPTCGSLTQKESGYIAELIWCAAIERGLPAVIDSSLRDVDFWKAMMIRMRQEHAQYRLCIMHVVASARSVFERVQRRAEQTGRMVPLGLLVDTLESVPKSVRDLSYIVDVLATIETTGPAPIFQGAQRGFGDRERGNVTWSGLVRAIVHGEVEGVGGKLSARL